MSGSEQFEGYLLKEYENIAEAHFKTIEAISSFFRYYLAILAIPITLVGIVAGLASKQELVSVVSSLRYPVFLVSVAIALVGLMVLLYVVNLRMDVILYARVVNAIRKYYFDDANLDQATKLQLRVLPQTPSLPRYSEPQYFLPVVLSFAVFDGMYVALGLAILYAQVSSTDIVLGAFPLEAWIATLGFAGIHLLLYFAYASYREHYYLKTYSMGVDIDGVLNEHRLQFCKLLAENVGTVLDPEKITTIPLHEDPRQGVSRDDEKAVFNDPSYWTRMPPKSDAAAVIQKLHKSFGLRIHIFSHRSWPSGGKSDPRYPEWVEAAREMLASKVLIGSWRLQVFGRPMNWLYKSWLRLRLAVPLPGLHVRPVEVITRCWLASEGIGYDKLTIERASEDVSDPRVRIRNRFYISRKKKVRFFVEDVSEKAFKLAYICDIVFIVEHPYNVGKKLTDNVIRVSSWGDIYKAVREFS